MNILNITGLGLGGINSDLRPWTLPDNMFTSGKNFRVFNNSILSSGGSRSMATPPVNNTPGYLLHVNSPLGIYWLSLGNTEVLAYNGSSWDTISSWAPGGSPLNDSDELLWTGCTIGRTAFTNNPQHYPEYWAPQTFGTDLQALPYSATDDWSTIGIKAKVLRSHKNFLFAFNLTESIDSGPVTEYPDAYRWSHPADTNGIPFSWDPLDLSSLAGRAQIGGNSGAIVDAKTLRNSLVIYSQNGISVLDPDPEFVWRRRELSSTHGLFNRNSLVEVNGSHYFLSDGDIVVTDGNSVKSILHNKLRTRLNSSAATLYYSRSFALRNDALKEIWFCVPEGNSQWPSTAYIYNWRDDSWGIRELPTGLVHGSFGPTVISTQAVVVVEEVVAAAVVVAETLTWVNIGGAWDEQTRKWNSGDPIPPDPIPPEGVFVWSIDSSGDIYGYTTNYGSLNPNKIQFLDITELSVNNINKDVIVRTNGKVLGSPTLTITLDTNETVQVTWDDIAELYIGNDTSFTNITVAANGTSIGVNIVVDDQAVAPPTTPITASGDTLVGLRRAQGNLEIIDPTTNDTLLNTIIERTDLLINGHVGVVAIARIYPHITGTQDVKLTFGSQQFNGGPVNWKNSVIFNPETQRKIDMRVRGALFAWRVESLSTGSWNISGMDIEYVDNGAR